MSGRRIDKWEDVTSTSDAIRFADASGKALVKHECGKYYSISTQKGTVHLYDNCRTMPKPHRELVRFWFWSLGILTTLALLLSPLWLPLLGWA